VLHLIFLVFVIFIFVIDFVFLSLDSCFVFLVLLSQLLPLCSESIRVQSCLLEENATLHHALPNDDFLSKPNWLP
jgi:hypothetical protein